MSTPSILTHTHTHTDTNMNS